jgi:fibronectin-binding autotransporter adhesin
LQARVNTAIAPADLFIRMHSNIPSSYRLNGLWLPDYNTSNYNGLVPYPRTGDSTVDHTVSAPPLWDFTLLSSDTHVKDGVTLEFFFELPGPVPLLCGYIDGYSFSDWYRRVRPWSFKIRDLRTQRGDATVTNNVINPLRGETVYVSYSIPQTGMVTINVFDLKGDIVDVLYRGQRTAGEYSTTWDGRNRGNRVVARGVYFIKIVGPGISEIRKVLVVK